MEIPKSQKKIAGEIIEIGLQRELANGIKLIRGITENWRENDTDHRATYQNLYKTLHDFDKHIAWRYDYITGSKYVQIVAAQLADQIITIEELDKFNDELKKEIIELAKLYTR